MTRTRRTLTTAYITTSLVLLFYDTTRVFAQAASTSNTIINSNLKPAFISTTTSSSSQRKTALFYANSPDEWPNQNQKPQIHKNFLNTRPSRRTLITCIGSLVLLFYDTSLRVVSAQAASTNNSKLKAAYISTGGSNSVGNTRNTALYYANEPDNPDKKPNINKKPNRMRAWTCHGRNQRDLVDRMMQAKIVRTESVRDVLSLVDRQHYAPPQQQQSQQQQSSSPYMDSPQPIGLGQTISAPHMHAHVLEEIYPFLKASNSSTVKILDVGCGSGYLTAALGRWVMPLPGDKSTGSLLDPNKTGTVFGIDIYPHLVNLTKRNMNKADQDLLDRNIVTVQVSDGWKGLPAHSPFDAIHVGAAAAEFPRALLQQLKVGGVLIIPVGPEGGVQNLYRVERLGGGFSPDDFRITELLGVRYVPLVQQQPTPQPHDT